MARAAQLLATLLASLAVCAAPVDEAKKLLEAGNASAAFDLLETNQDSANGLEFDYLYGIAALDSGRPGLALFAFERVLAVDPNHLYARAELARALLRLGEKADAQREFARVKSLNPPPEVLAQVEKYAAAMRSGGGPTYKITGFMEAFGGYDSNYASATEERSVGIPAFGNLLFTLDDLFVEDASAAVGGRGGARVVAQLNPRTVAYGGVAAEGTHYPGANADFYQASVAGNLGIAYELKPRNIVSATLNAYDSWVPELNYLRVAGVTFKWDYQVSEQGLISSFVSLNDLEFDEAIEYRDVRQYLLGTGYTHVYQERLKIGGHIFGGTEDEQEDRRPDVGRDIYGVRLASSYAFSDQVTGFANFVAQFSDYGAPDGLFLRTREDEQVRLNGGVEYRFSPLWSARPEVIYVNNSSNIPTSDFERVAVMVSVRRSFE